MERSSHLKREGLKAALRPGVRLSSSVRHLDVNLFRAELWNLGLKNDLQATLTQ